MFTVNRVVIHEVKRDNSNDPVTLDLSTRLSNIEEDSVLKTLIERVNDVFGNTPSLKNSRFDDLSDTPFSTLLKAYILDQSDANFLDFSLRSIEKLKELIEEEPWAKGGFYCFSDYVDNGRRCIAVILLRRKDSFNFTKTGGIFRAQGGETVNYDKIAMGFRLNVQMFAEHEDGRNYIALITSQHDQLSSYFKEWVSVTGIISKEVNTKSLVRLVRELPMPTLETGENAYLSTDAFHKAIYDYVEQSHQKKVSLTEMSKYFYGEQDERKILDLATTRQVVIDNEFVRDSKIWKRVIAVKAQIPGIKLFIDHDKLNGGIVSLTDTQVVINSNLLVAQIRAQQNG